MKRHANFTLFLFPAFALPIIRHNAIFKIEDGFKVYLTRTETQLLHLLVSAMGQVIPFESIERSVWYEKQATPDTIRMYINKLRAKLYYELIENIQGYGYKLVPQP